MMRRELLRLAVTSGALMTSTLVTGSPTSITLGDHEAVNRHLWQVYARAESKSTVMPAVTQQLHSLHDALVQGNTSATVRRLCELHSEVLQLSGEILYDAGLYDDATNSYMLAASAAKEANSFDLWASALTRYALSCMSDDRWSDSKDLLDTAARIVVKGDSALPTRQWIASVRAEVAATEGDISNCQYALEAADTVMELPDPVGNDGWLRFNGKRLPEQRASCFITLGMYDQASTELERALKNQMTPRRKSAVLCDQARIALQQHEYEAARDHIRTVANLAARTGSTYITKKLLHLQPVIKAQGNDPRAVELAELITTTVQAT